MNAGEAIATRIQENPLDELTGQISVSVRKEDSNFVIAVMDNGCGLPDEQRNRLFEPYITTREKGTGLGLAIVQKIAEQHNGRVILEDAPTKNGFGGGACVRLIIPLSSQSASVNQNEIQSNSNENLHNNALS